MYIIRTSIYEVQKQAAVVVFFSGGADVLCNMKMYKIAECQDYKPDLVQDLTKSSTFTVPVIRYDKQPAKRAFTSEEKLRQEDNWELTVKEEVTPQLLLTGRSLERKI